MSRRVAALALILTLAGYSALVTSHGHTGCFEDETRIKGKCIPTDNLTCGSDSDCEALEDKR